MVFGRQQSGIGRERAPKTLADQSDIKPVKIGRGQTNTRCNHPKLSKDDTDNFFRLLLSNPDYNIESFKSDFKELLNNLKACRSCSGRFSALGRAFLRVRGLESEDKFALSIEMIQKELGLATGFERR